LDFGWYIRLNKRVPLGAGLGGGSSDAAAVLIALNKVCSKPFSNKELEYIAAKLGSDVPFFIKGGTAYVTGRGEQISPLSVTTPWAVLLINPGLHSSTPEAFRLLDRVRNKTREYAKAPLGKDVLLRLLEGHPQNWTFYNDFLEVFLQYGTLEVQQTYQEILQALKEEKADFINLSGSGSTCFGVFIDHEKARRAHQNLKGRWPLVELAFPLARKVNPVVE